MTKYEMLETSYSYVMKIYEAEYTQEQLATGCGRERRKCAKHNLKPATSHKRSC